MSRDKTTRPCSPITNMLYSDAGDDIDDADDETDAIDAITGTIGASIARVNKEAY